MSDVPINPPRRIRAALYLSGTLGAPTVVYLSSTGRIGDALSTLLGAYIAIVLALATANTIKPADPGEPHDDTPTREAA